MLFCGICTTFESGAKMLNSMEYALSDKLNK